MRGAHSLSGVPLGGLDAQEPGCRARADGWLWLSEWRRTNLSPRPHKRWVRDDTDRDDALGLLAAGGVGDGDLQVVAPDGERRGEFHDLDQVEVPARAAAGLGHCLGGPACSGFTASQRT